jgi:hypothetical protein
MELLNKVLSVLLHLVWPMSWQVQNGLAPVQVFYAVPSPPFSAPAELAGLGPGHSKARCVFPVAAGFSLRHN